jgi:hypothetical protein
MSDAEPKKFLTRTEGYITVDIPPIHVPTPLAVARWLRMSSALRCLVLIAIGWGIGHWGQYRHVVPDVPPPPPPVITVTKTLTDFVSRESQALSADERRKLIAATETILAQHFETPSALREEFYYLRLKTGLHDSPGFNTFWNKVAETIARSDSKGDDSVESMRTIYTELLRGLSSHSGEPVEGFDVISPSIITSSAESEDEPVTPGFVERSQRHRIFRRR